MDTKTIILLAICFILGFAYLGLNKEYNELQGYYNKLLQQMRKKRGD